MAAMGNFQYLTLILEKYLGEGGYWGFFTPQPPFLPTNVRFKFVKMVSMQALSAHRLLMLLLKLMKLWHADNSDSVDMIYFVLSKGF